MTQQPDNEQVKLHQLAEQVRGACIEAAREGFQDASISGLCTEGAIEAAVGAIQSLDLEKVIKRSSG